MSGFLGNALLIVTGNPSADVKRDAPAVAAGIREGSSRDKPLDLNRATKEQLLTLPRVTAAEADRVIAGRSYNKPDGTSVTRPDRRVSL